jgi:hypothetical protein
MEITSKPGQYSDGRREGARCGRHGQDIFPGDDTITEESLGDCRLNTDCGALFILEWRGNNKILAPDPLLSCMLPATHLSTTPLEDKALVADNKDPPSTSSTRAPWAMADHGRKNCGQGTMNTGHDTSKRPR